MSTASWRASPLRRSSKFPFIFATSAPSIGKRSLCWRSWVTARPPLVDVTASALRIELPRPPGNSGEPDVGLFMPGATAPLDFVLRSGVGGLVFGFVAPVPAGLLPSAPAADFGEAAALALPGVASIRVPFGLMLV